MNLILYAMATKVWQLHKQKKHDLKNELTFANSLC